VVPLLHVLPMTTGYDCSAAAALSCFDAFALKNTKGAFDVRWCQGNLSDLIFTPWAQQLVERGVQLRGNCRLTQLVQQPAEGTATATASTTTTTKRAFTLTINAQEEMTFDAVILAIGSTAAKRLAQPVDSPIRSLSSSNINVPYSSQWKTGVTCVAVRLFLDRNNLPTAFLTALAARPAVTVCGPRIVMPLLVETGFCVYDLSRLQKGASFNKEKDWLVLEVDFFRANAVAKLTDAAIVDLALAAIEKVIIGPKSGHPQQPLLRTESVLDAGIVRARDAVSHFSMGAGRSSPPIRIAHGLYMCGDWIDRTGHASWSTEKAVVTGIGAATQLANDFGASTANMPSILSASSSEDDAARKLLQRAVRQSASAIRTVRTKLFDE
jgi:uncharacterized protein with NAD-binding domain and iron-sulfur cluster